MSKTIHDVMLLELLPPNLRNDLDIIAASRAVDEIFHETAGLIGRCLTIVDIDNAQSEIVDMLAIEMNIDYYDQTLPLENRRALVKNAYVYKYQKGTAFAVEQVVSDAFDAGQVQEWFEYGGQPYRFRVVTEADLPDIETINQIFKAIESVKNKRSHIDSLAALKYANLNLHLGFASKQTKIQRILKQL